MINLGNLSEPLQEFITKQAKDQDLGKNEIILQILAWAYLQYQQGFEEYVMIPSTYLPKYLTPDKNPLTRLTRVERPRMKAF